MHYDLQTLGWQNFEHLAQALIAPMLNNTFSVFGSGADGGREATWRGVVPSFTGDGEWSGYGVLQAKYREIAADPSDNLRWLSGEIGQEIQRWRGRRTERPRHLLFVTNVRLSAQPGGGKETIAKLADDWLADLGSGHNAVRVLDYDDVRAHLDGNAAVRRRYAGFLLAGEQLFDLAELAADRRERLRRAITLHAAQTLVDDARVGLTQAGSITDTRPTLADVFVDLPLSEGRDDERWRHAAASIIDELDRVDDDGLRRFVLVGGPGQGKSTITQWLVELYRLRFVLGEAVLRDDATAREAAALRARCAELGARLPGSRRWPVRIDVAALAVHLTRHPTHGLLDVMAQMVGDRTRSRLDVDDLRAWLGRHPWLLLLDGFDEIPAAVGQRAIAERVRDLLQEAAAVDADLAIVVTTRPQGYGNVFAADRYRHLRLDVLRPAEAIDYAKRVAVVRRGPVGSVGHEDLTGRFSRAIRDDGLARMCETPLQVTIVLLLLDLDRNAPRDRYRLFARYYEVTKQRELQKDTELARLLQLHAADVDAIHRDVGHLLQQRRSSAEPSLTRDEFEQIVRRRLERQWDDAEVRERLLTEFRRLVTERLVLITFVTADEARFEIASLREFMTAEYVLDGDDQAVLTALRARLRSSSWRNVVLFAIGGIFATRERLGGAVCVELIDLDRSLQDAAQIGMGAELAAEVLQEGSTLAQPRFGIALATMAADLLRIRLTGSVRQLARIAGTEPRRVILDRAAETLPATPLEWFNRLSVLSQFAAADPDHRQTLTRVAQAVPAAAMQPVAKIAIGTQDDAVLTALASRIGELEALDLFAAVVRRESGFRSPPSRTAPAWLWHLVACAEATDPWSGAAGAGAGSLGFTGRPLRAGHHSWDWLADFAKRLPGWRRLGAIAEFARSPTPSTLREAIRVLRSSGPLPAAIFPYLPWVVQVVLRAALRSPDGWQAYLSRVERMAGQGVLGDTDDWATAERRLRGATTIDDLTVSPPVIDGVELPVWPGLAKAGAPVDAVKVFPLVGPVPSATADAALGQLIGALFSADRTSRRAQVARLACALATRIADSRAADGRDPSKGLTAVRSTAGAHLAVIAEAAALDPDEPVELGWLTTIQSDLSDPSTLNALALFGALDSTPPSERIGAHAATAWVRAAAGAPEGDRPWLARLLLRQSFLSVRDVESLLSVPMPPDPRLAAPLLIMRLQRCDTDALRDGALDDEIAQVGRSDDSALDDLIVHFLNPASGWSLLLLTRCARVLLESSPISADSLLISASAVASSEIERMDD